MLLKSAHGDNPDLWLTTKYSLEFGEKLANAEGEIFHVREKCAPHCS